MARALNLTGQVFCYLIVFAYECSRPGSSRIWRCRCRCGKTVFASSKNLTRGRVKSCGCWRRTVGAQIMGAKHFKNLTGRKFGRLTALDVVGRYGRGRTCLWECACECGNVVRVPVSSLTTGATKSCGCLKSEIVSRTQRERHQLNRERSAQ